MTELTFRNKVTVSPSDVHDGDAFAIKIVAWVNPMGWAAYEGFSYWADEMVAEQGDMLLEETARDLFYVLDRSGLSYRGD